MSRVERIGLIRQRRAQQAHLLEERVGALSDVLAGLQTIEALRAQLVGVVPDEARDKLQALGTDLQGLLKDLPLETAALKVALTRFNRETLNVGVIGRARQGKSRLIQSLTGLTEQEVPTSDGDYCTGVTSVLRHEPGEARGEVYFHTERSFLGEVIGPYFARLGLGDAPLSLAGFARPLPALNSDDTEDAGLYAHLAGFHTYLPAYRDWLTTGLPLPIPRHQIRSFVAQKDENERSLHAYRAVREVRITAPFVHADWTGLSLVDLPGLGEANLQDAERIVGAMQDEIDFVVFVRRPNALGDAIGSEDLRLHQYVRAGLGSGPALSECSFLIVNKCVTSELDNSKQAELMAHQWLPGSSFTVAQTHIVDCSRSDEVADVMEKVVDHLLENLDHLDAAHLAVRDERARELRDRVRQFTVRAKSIAEFAQPSSVWFLPFVELFNETHSRLATALAGLVRTLGQERSVQDTLLYTALEEIYEQAVAEPGHPSAEEIAARAASEGGLSIAYGQYLNEARARLSRMFLECEAALHSRTVAMQRQVAQILAGPGDLASLSSKEGRDFLLDVAARIPRVRDDGTSEVRYALELLAGFQLTYRGMLQHRVRACLDGLRADQPAYPFPVAGKDPGTDDTPVTPDLVRQMLIVCYDEALSACRADLRHVLVDPSAAIFAIVEEFFDRVVSAAGTDDEWRIFYQDIRTEAWPGKFAALAEQSHHLREWSEAVRVVAELVGETVHEPQSQERAA
ncbi:hypothetical protein [Streptomyces sp. NPDC001851]|uniref:hypothetical protein n=1 Tax=Streptomyces sp. NPDC001851 TaxID=3154529 RepID=UPI00332F1BB0